MQSNKTARKFQMIQDHIFKYKKLKNNLIQSQQFGQNLKSQLLKIGSQCNSLLISVSSMTSDIGQLKSLIPKMSKELNLTKEELKRVEYKTQKVEIKQKQYEERVRRFHNMFNSKKEKNQATNYKIQKLQEKIAEEKQKETKIEQQLTNLQSKQQPENNQSLRMFSNRNSIKLNPCDQMELQILTDESKLKKLKQQKEEVCRKNSVLKSNINKIQLKIIQIDHFLSQNSLIPHFNQLQLNNKSEQRQEKQTLNRNELGKRTFSRHQDKITPYNSVQEKSQKEKIGKQSSKLPNYIVSSLSGFQNMKSKTILDPLLQKHGHMIKLEQTYVQNLQQSYSLISELSKLNSVLESEVIQENNRISSFSIRGKKYTEKHRKTIN